MSNYILSAKERKIYQQFCGQTSISMIKCMLHYLRKKHYTNITCTKDYLYAEGTTPAALVAHSDTVFKYPPQLFFYDTEQNVIWSPDGMGADDRAGIFAIYKILQMTELRPSIIITNDEEIGCVGAINMTKQIKALPNVNFLIELDRRGIDDAVYYDCDNPEFTQYINNFGFKTALGSFSDISVLASAYGVAAVNLSIGYMNEHSSSEYLYIDAMYTTINKVLNILRDVVENKKNVKFKYIAATSTIKLSAFDSEFFEKHICNFCGKTVSNEHDLIPIFTKATNDKTVMLHACADCAKDESAYFNICPKCGELWYLNSYIAQHGICPDCAEKDKQ